MKLCKKCLVEKSENEFQKASKMKDGLLSNCKSCESLWRKEYTSKNKDKTKAWQKAHKSKHPENYTKEKYKEQNDKNIEYRAKRYLLNREKILVKQAEYYAIPDVNSKIKERVRNWRKNNPEKARVLGRNKRARRKNASGSHTAQQINNLLRLQHGKCIICKNVLASYHANHIFPLARGGANDIGNIQILCPKCNMHKSAKDPIKFMQSRGFLL